MNLNNGKGDVVYKNKKYYEKENLLYNYFTAIEHKNNNDWWIIQPIEEDSLFLTYLLNENGINRVPDQNSHQYFTRWRSSGSGNAKFSPDGTQYALYNYTDQLNYAMISIERLAYYPIIKRLMSNPILTLTMKDLMA